MPMYRGSRRTRHSHSIHHISAKVTEKPSHYWIKVKNPRYSQLEGRQELFERG
jgi:hypothetical protein